MFPSCSVAAKPDDGGIKLLSTMPLHALLSTGGVVVDLVAPLTALLRPGEVGDGDEEEGIAWVGDTGERVVPGASVSDVFGKQMMNIFALTKR